VRRMGRQENDTPMRNPIDMAPPRRNPEPDFRAGPYMPLPIPPRYERGPYKPMPLPPGHERGPYKPMPLPPINPGPGPYKPMPQTPFMPEDFDDYFKRDTGFNTSETARENFISRTDGGYPKRQDPSFMDKYGDYINRGLDHMPSPIGIGSRILKGLPSLYGGNAAEIGDDNFIDSLIEDLKRGDDEASGIMGAMPEERQTAGIYQTWRKIADKLGEAYANDWLASQQAV